MTPIKPLLIDDVLYIDNSSMELFTTCPRQAYYYIIRRLELNRDKIALDFGGAFHTCLEYIYKKYGNSYRSASQNQDIIDFVSRTITIKPTEDEAAARQRQILAGTILPPVLITPEDDYRTLSYLIEGVQKYITDYPMEPFELLTLKDTPAVEIPFAMPIGEVDTSFGTIKIVWTGKIDLPYRSRKRLGVMDHKTTSMMGPQFFTEFEFAHQMYGYVAAVEYIMQEEVAEVTINGLGCRKPTRTGEKFTFQRHIIPINRDLLEEWHTDSLAIVSDFLAHCERGYFPKATKWCVSKYGPCQYRTICNLSPSNREFALSTNEFRNVTWDPLKQKE